MNYTTPIDVIISQTENTYDWVNKILSTTPVDKWEVCPETISSHICWQVGHLIISCYYHSIEVIVGHKVEILREVPIKKYSELFGYNSIPQNAIGKIKIEELQKDLRYIQKESLHVIKSLSNEQLLETLIQSNPPHPVATNKLEALDWNNKHTMWHCGQIGIIKRIIDKRYDFGLEV